MKNEREKTIERMNKRKRDREEKKMEWNTKRKYKSETFAYAIQDVDAQQSFPDSNI